MAAQKMPMKREQMPKQMREQMPKQMPKPKK